MKDVEQRLRETFLDERRDLPVQEGLLDRVEAGIRRVRRRRRRAVTGLAATIALIAVLTGLVRLPGEGRPAGPAMIAVPGGGIADQLLVIDDSLYVLTQRRHVYRVDRSSRRIVATSARLTADVTEFLAVGDTVWVKQWLDFDRQPHRNMLYLIGLDPHTLKIRHQVPIGAQDVSAIALQNSLWTEVSQRPGKWVFTRHDPATGAVLGAIGTPWSCEKRAEIQGHDRQANTVVVHCWGNTAGPPSHLAVLDAQTGAVRASRDLKPPSGSVFAGTPGRLWVSYNGHGGRGPHGGRRW